MSIKFWRDISWCIGLAIMLAYGPAWAAPRRVPSIPMVMGPGAEDLSRVHGTKGPLVMYIGRPFCSAAHIKRVRASRRQAARGSRARVAEAQ